MTSIFQFRNGLLFVLFIFITSVNQAQPSPSGWGSVFVNGPFQKKWGLYLDAQVRSTNGMDMVKSWLFRPGLHYQPNKHNLITVGYAYVHNRINSPGIRAYLPEHRLWQQWTHLQPIRYLTLQHRLRMEQRFIGATQFMEGTGTPSASFYSTRLRYFNRLLLPLGNKHPFTKGPFGAIQNEVFLHLTGSKKLNGKLYDQDRLYVAVGYRASKQFDVECGYMLRNIGTTQNSSNQHTWQLAVYLRPE